MGYRPSCNPIVQHIFSYPANQNNSLSHHQTVRQPIAVEIRQYAINNNWLSYFLWKKFRIPLVPLDRLSSYAESLGYPEVDRSSFVDILHFLTDPQEMFECRQKIENLASTTLEASNNQPLEI